AANHAPTLSLPDALPICHTRALLARLAQRTLRARAALSRAPRAPLSPPEAPTAPEPAALPALSLEGPPTLVDEAPPAPPLVAARSEEHTSELQSREKLLC